MEILGATTTYGYDIAGNMTSMTDPNGHTTTYTYGQGNRPIKTTTPDLSVITTIYDANGNVCFAKTDPTGIQWPADTTR